MGLLIIFIVHHIPYRFYSTLSVIFLIAAIFTLAFTLAMGTQYNEAQRWVTLPGLGFTIQTSDFAKLALVMYIARVLSIKQNKIRDFKSAFLPIAIPVSIVCLLILPENFSSAALLFGVSMVLMFIGRIRFKYLMLFILVGILALGAYIGIASLVDGENRIETWEQRIASYRNQDNADNYQVEQAKIAIVNGGVFGKGPGNSTQRNFLPQPYSDFIFAIIIEEYGLIGGVIIVFLYLYLLFRTGVIVRRSDRTFPAFLAIGLGIILVFQAMVNMGVAVNLLPVTGQTLPLVSMGGTSMLFTSVSFGIILGISRSLQEKEEEQQQLEEEQQQTVTAEEENVQEE